MVQTTEVAVRQVVADTKADQIAPLTVPLTAPEPGTYRLRVESLRQDGELVTTNNVQTAFVDVREGGGRILYLEGSLRYEQTLLRRSLRRFQDLDLTFLPILKDTFAPLADRSGRCVPARQIRRLHHWGPGCDRDRQRTIG